ncbi:hypothetical protein JKP88DRAFT_339028 [Tribonema minus]|uniref:Uncharacterized protein n=1 Tax=Tribonema minus TaxID=303371 RepID=A0A835YIL7_9STRA|nr:hypothetical protein JKP88DRAFT_339028 [Tribonema minus]
MSASSKKRKASTPAAPAVVVKTEISEAAAWDARELQARRGEPLTRDIVEEELDTLWNTWMNTPANSRMRRVRLQHEFPGGMAAWERARALQAAIDKTVDTTEWEALRLELCTLLWLAQHAYPRLHLGEGQAGWYPLPRSLQGSGGGVAEEMDLTEQEDERQHEDAVNLTAAHVLPPATLYPQERKLLTDQLQKLLARVQNPPPAKQQLCLLVDEYLRWGFSDIDAVLCTEYHYQTMQGIESSDSMTQEHAINPRFYNVMQYPPLIAATPLLHCATCIYRFMDLKRAAPPESLSPAAAIDDVWLSHVVCTSAYAAFCERHFGAFVHHEPISSSSSGRYQPCLEAYRRQYTTVPPPSCWPEPPEADDASAASGMTARVPSATGGGDGGGGGDAEGASMSSAPVVAAAAAAAGAHQPRAAHSEAAAEPSAADKPVSLAAGSHIQMPLQGLILNRPRADYDGGGAATMQQIIDSSPERSRRGVTTAVSSPLLDTAIVRHVLTFVGTGSWRYTAGVCKTWLEEYQCESLRQFLTRRRGIKVTTFACASASLSCLKLFHSDSRTAEYFSMSYEEYPLLWRAIGAQGDISIAEWAFSNLSRPTSQPSESDSESSITDDYGDHLDMRPREAMPHFLKGAAGAGKLAVLDWACTHGVLHLIPRCVRAVAEGATTGGSLDAIKWLHAQLGSSDAALRQVTVNRRGLCELDLRAAQAGRLDVLMWLKEHGLLMEAQRREASKACSKAAAGCDDPNVIAWLRAEGYGWGSDICYAAAKPGHVEVLKWLQSNSCPDWANVEDKFCIDITWQSSCIPALAWLKSISKGRWDAEGVRSMMRGPGCNRNINYICPDDDPSRAKVVAWLSQQLPAK